jgi:microcystin-dependent protein
MAQPFIGEIRMFGGNFAPAGWAFCNGALMPISENDALFVLIGTTYGGDGQETFALPNLQGRLPLHQGTNLGQTFQMGETGGVESVTLTTNQIPVHTHSMLAVSGPVANSDPTNGILAKPTGNIYNSVATNIVQFSNQAVLPIGGSQPHDNFQPYLCISFIISLFGIFPSQT